MKRIPLAVLVPNPVGRLVLTYCAPFAPAVLVALLVLLALPSSVPGLAPAFWLVSLRTITVLVFSAVYLWLFISLRRHFASFK
jgi:hypothetical protein